MFHSHYFDVLLDECKKVWTSGKGKAVRDGYKDVYKGESPFRHTCMSATIHTVYHHTTEEAFGLQSTDHTLKIMPACLAEMK